MTHLHEAKRLLRAEARATRRGLQAADADRGVRFVEHFTDLMGHPDLPDGGVAAAYWPMGSEADTQPLLHHLHDAGWQVLLPLVAAPDTALSFVPWQPEVPLKEGAHNTVVPEGAPVNTMPDIIVVPLLAWDVYGGRLGQGGGYYDRTIAALRSKAVEKSRAMMVVGLAYEGQRIDAVPLEEHDQLLDALVTEQSWHQFRD